MMALDRLVDAFDRLDMDAIQENPRHAEILVADNISLDVWNRLTDLETLTHNFHLRQLVWANDMVWVVEASLTPAHEGASGACRAKFFFAFGELVFITGHMSLMAPGQPTFEADDSLRPDRRVPGIQPPTNLRYREWATVIIEVLQYQECDSVHHKVQVYRQRPGVEYILCVKMSVDLQEWSYELYDVRNDMPAFPAMANRSSFNLNTNGIHIIQLESWRVLGLAQETVLPPNCSPVFALDMVALASDVFINDRDYW